jgi:hypothetical protein
MRHGMPEGKEAIEPIVDNVDTPFGKVRVETY